MFRWQTLSALGLSCFHLFWLENAGWRGVLGAAAVFWEGEAGEEPDGELGGAARDGFVCSFLFSSSMETART